MIYLDHAASSPLAPGVLEAMLPWLQDNCANPSSIHTPGRKARQAVEDARERIARVLGCQSDDIIFTSGGTEANNMVMKSYIALHERVVVSNIEHDSVLQCARHADLYKECDVTYLPSDDVGLISPQSVREAMRPGTRLVAVMAVNNELGTIQPIKEIHQEIQLGSRGYPPCRLLVDGVQAVGHIPLSMKDLPRDFLTLSAHKFGGPKGVGLVCCPSMPPEPMILGGGQEDGFRSGTENVAGIVGMATALEYAERTRIENEKRYETLAKFLLKRVRTQWNVCLNGSLERRTWSNLNLLIPGVEAEAVLLMLDLAGIGASAGSACHASGSHPSHVLKAIGLTEEEARSSLRLTMGPETTQTDLEYVADKLIQIIGDLKRT